ncbi:MAG TPA: hypothetical protein VNF99_02015 [Stellaceae bacterium]|nr:hypothetical protein [Stellaceae bacterium]
MFERSLLVSAKAGSERWLQSLARGRVAQDSARLSRAERLEMILAAASMDIGECPAWIVLTLERSAVSELDCIELHRQEVLMLTNPFDYVQPTSETEREHLESLIRADYERCYPGETLEDVKRRASFSKEDRGQLRDWMAVAAARAVVLRAAGVPAAVTK